MKLILHQGYFFLMLKMADQTKFDISNDQNEEKKCMVLIGSKFSLG